MFLYHGDKINSDNSENTDLRAKPREGYEQRHFIEVYETLCMERRLHSGTDRVSDATNTQYRKYRLLQHHVLSTT